jgi:hypothetical protein
MEITREPVANNSPELISKNAIVGVVPVFDDEAINYRFDVMTVIRICLDNGDNFDVELQEVTNQATWNGGSKMDLDNAIDDINNWLPNDVVMLTGYSYVRTVTIDNRGNPEALTDQQIEIDLTSSNFTFANAKTNGEDIRFSLSDGTLLNYWIHSYNSGAQTGKVYVKLPSCAALSMVNVYLFYGNAVAVAATSWTNTMYRRTTNLKGGDTKYLLRLSEGSGATLTNTGSVGGTVSMGGTAPTWNADVVHGAHGGNSLVFNGTNNSISIPGLLDTWPAAGEISGSFILTSLLNNPTIFTKINRVSGGGGDNGDMVRLIHLSGTGRLYFQTYYGANFDPIEYPVNTAINTLYNFNIIWGHGSVAFYINGVCAGKAISQFNNGSAKAFKIGEFDTNAYFTGRMNDFRVTDYAAGTPLLLPQAEMENLNVKPFQNNQRNKFSWNKQFIAGNFPASPGAAFWSGEPCSMYDADDGKYKMWFTHGGGIVRYREALTYDGLAAASETQIYGAGTGGEAGQVYRIYVYKEAGTYYMFHAEAGDTGPIYVTTSTNGTTGWTSKITALDDTTHGFPGLANCCVIKVGSTYYMSAGENTGNPSQPWAESIASATSPQGPYTPIGINPRTAFQLVANGIYGGNMMYYHGGLFHIWYQAEDNPGADYGQIFYCTSPDLDNFSTPVLIQSIADELIAHDQTADAHFTTDGAKCFLDTTGLDNRTQFYSCIMRCVFNGNSSALLRDFGVSVGSETLIIDPDALAHISSGGITDPLHIEVLDFIVKSAKGYDSSYNASSLDCWTDLIAAYPFIGGTSQAHKLNLKDPRDLDAAFRIVWGGTRTDNSTGTSGNGVNGYGNTKFNPFLHASINSFSWGRYATSPGGAATYGTNYSNGAFTTVGGNRGVHDFGPAAGLITAPLMTPPLYNHVAHLTSGEEATRIGAFAGAPTRWMGVASGHVFSRRSTTTHHQGYKGTVNLPDSSANPNTAAATTLPNAEFHIGAVMVDTTKMYYHNMVFGFLWFANFSDEPRCFVMDAIITRAQVMLGRNV